MSKRTSLTTLLWTDPDSGEAQSITFDATTGETKDDTVDITDHPVEVGSNISDNARDAPALLTIEAIVSETINIGFDPDLVVVPLPIFPMVKSRSIKQIELDVPSPPIQRSESGLIQAGIGALKRAHPVKATVVVTNPEIDIVGVGAGARTSDVKAMNQGSDVFVFFQKQPRNRVWEVYDKLLLLKEQHVTLDMIHTAYRDYIDMMVARVSQPRTLSDGQSAKFQIDFKQIRVASGQRVLAAPKPAEVRGNTAQSKGSQGTKPADQQEARISLAKRLRDALPNGGN